MPFNDAKTKLISKNSLNKNLVFSWAGPEFKIGSTRAHIHTPRDITFFFPMLYSTNIDMYYEFIETYVHIWIVISHFLSSHPLDVSSGVTWRMWSGHFLSLANTQKTQTSASLLPPAWSRISPALRDSSCQRVFQILAFLSPHLLSAFCSVGILSSPCQEDTFVLASPSAHSCVTPREIQEKSW